MIFWSIKSETKPPSRTGMSKSAHSFIWFQHHLFSINRFSINRCEICLMLTIKPPKRRQWRRFGGFIVNFEHISHLCSSSSIVNFEHVIAGWVTWIRLLALFFALVTNMQMKIPLHLSVIKVFWFHFVCCKWLHVTSEAAIRGVLRPLKINSKLFEIKVISLKSICEISQF